VNIAPALSPEKLSDVWLARLQLIANGTAVLFAVSLCLPMTVNWVTLILALIIWGLLLCLRTVGGDQVYQAPPLTWPLLGMAAAACLSGVLHGGLREAWESLTTLRPMLAYFWAYDLFRRNERLQLLCVSALLSLSAVSGYWGTIQQVTGYHPFGFQYLQGTGFLAAPMAFSGQMQLFSLITLALGLTKAFKHMFVGQTVLFGMILVGNVLGLIFAAERSAWLGFIIGATLVTLLVSCRTAAKLAGLSSVLFLGAWFALPVFQKRLLPLLDWQHDVSTRARFVVWDEAWRQFLRFPLYGIGVRKFPHVYIPEALVPGQARYLGHAHSNYLHVLATTGLFGFAMYIWLLLESVRLAWMQFWMERTAVFTQDGKVYSFRAAIALGLLGSLVSLAVAGIFEYNFGTSQVRLAEWFLLALLIPRRSN
jgi:O-antigen ligase